MQEGEIIAAVRGVPYWRHRISLPFGIETPGQIGRDLLDRLALDGSLTGARVLDVGTFDGLCAFEAERLGAGEVVGMDTWTGKGTDNPQWWNQMHTGGKGFEVACAALQSATTGLECSVYALSPDTHGYFNIVIMCGLIYHLRDPLIAIEKALGITKDYLLIESAFVEFEDNVEPTVNFVRRRGALINPSNWWEFSRMALEDLCYVAGARTVTIRNIVWHTVTHRSIQLGGQPMSLYCAPRTDAECIHHLNVVNTITVVGRRYILRDGLNWLRVCSDSDAGLTGWFRFDDGLSLPPITMTPVRGHRREGRVVLEVSP